MHRFVWNLIWDSSGGPSADEDSEYQNPSGPKAVPGTYEVRLTVDGKVHNQSLKIIMDPRSPATAEVLTRQLELGRQIFGETLEARRALAEISSVQKKLADVDRKLDQKPEPKLERRKLETQDGQLKLAVEKAQAALVKILTSRENDGGGMAGLTDANVALASALRVVESGDREVPAQAIAVFQEASQQVKTRIVEWTQFKQTVLSPLNEELRKSNLAPIAIGGI